MIPTQYKIIGVLLIAGGLFSSGFYMGKNLEEGETAKEDNKLIVKQIEVHNEQERELEVVIKEIETIRIEYRDKIVRLPPIDVSEPCPIGDLTRLRNEAYGSLDQSLFESTSALSSTIDGARITIEKGFSD